MDLKIKQNLSDADFFEYVNIKLCAFNKNERDIVDGPPIILREIESKCGVHVLSERIKAIMYLECLDSDRKQIR